MDREFVLACCSSDGAKLLKSPHRSTTSIVRVLCDEKPGFWRMNISMSNRSMDGFGVKNSTRSIERPNHAARKCSRGASFIMNDVTFAVCNDLVTRFTVSANRKLIRHRSAWHKESGFFAKHQGNFSFERLHGWLVTEYIVPKRCGHHRDAHLRRWLRDGITAKIKNVHGSDPSGHQFCRRSINCAFAPFLLYPSNLWRNEQLFLSLGEWIPQLFLRG